MVVGRLLGFRESTDVGLTSPYQSTEQTGPNLLYVTRERRGDE